MDILKILYDAFWWNEGPTSNREVMRQILFAWQRNFDDAITLFVRAGAHSLPQDTDVVRTAVRPHGVAVWSAFAKHARVGGYDGVFTQNFSVSHPRSVTFVHDLLFKSNPEWFTPSERAYFLLISRSLGKAQTLVTSSASEAERIRRYAPLGKVFPVGLGPSGTMLDAPASRPDFAHFAEYVLVVGRANVRKNLVNAALAALRSGVLSRNRPLVAVGEDWTRIRNLDSRLAEAIDSKLIVAPGFVDAASLKWLYSHCSTFLMVSLGEGFGMPIAEAAVMGVPIVASNIPVFHETVKDAYWVQPTDIDSIADGLRRAISERRPSKPLKAFDWSEVASSIRREMFL